MKNLDEKPPGLEQKVPLLYLIPKTRENRYFYENGLTKWIPRLTLKVHSDIEECYKIWEKFSPQKSLFDLWDFRYAWYEGYQYKPYFYTLYEGKSSKAVLPLWYSQEKKRYEWFGSNWMEDNTFFTEEQKFADLLLKVAPSPIHLNALSKGDLVNKDNFGKISPEDPKNLKDIKDFKNVDGLLQSLDKKHRYNLRSDFLKIMNADPKIEEHYGRDENLINELIKMNIDQFDNGNPEDESDLVIAERAKTYRAIVKNSGTYKVKFIKVHIQDHLAAVDFVIQYKDVYYSIKGGNDLNRFKGIGNFMIYYEFEDAIKNNFALIDCLQVDYGWKHRFFKQHPLYLFEK